jgi:uncharacterized membrane protein
MISMYVVLATFVLIGVWMVVDPVQLLDWLKNVRPDLRDNPDFMPNDPRAKSVAKFIGYWFIGLPILIYVCFLFARNQ